MAILGCGVSSLVGILRQAGCEYDRALSRREGHTLRWPQVRSSPSPHSSHPSLLTLMLAPVSKPHCPSVCPFTRPLVVMVFGKYSMWTHYQWVLFCCPPICMYSCIVARQTAGWMMGCNLCAVCWAQFHCLGVATVPASPLPLGACDPWLVGFTNKWEAVI